MIDAAIADAAAYIIYIDYPALAADFIAVEEPDTDLLTRASAVVTQITASLGYQPDIQITKMVAAKLRDPLWRFEKDILWLALERRQDANSG